MLFFPQISLHGKFFVFEIWRILNGEDSEEGAFYTIFLYSLLVKTSRKPSLNKYELRKMCETVQLRFHVFPREGAPQCAAHGKGRGSGGVVLRLR